MYYLHVCMYMYSYIWIHSYVHIYVRIHVYTYMSVCEYACVHVCVYEYFMCVYLCIYSLRNCRRTAQDVAEGLDANGCYLAPLLPPGAACIYTYTYICTCIFILYISYLCTYIQVWIHTYNPHPLSLPGSLSFSVPLFLSRSFLLFLYLLFLRLTPERSISRKHSLS